MAKVSLFLDNRHKGKDDKFPLVVRFSALNKSTAHLATPYRLSESDWDKNRGVILKSCKYYNSVAENLKLQQHLNEVNMFVFNLPNQNKKASEIRDLFVNSRSVKSSRFVDIIDVVIVNRKENNERAQTYINYTYLKKIFIRYKGEDVDIKEINNKFVLDFIAYLKSLNYKQNSILTQINLFASVYNYAISVNLAEQKDYPFRNLHLKKEKTRHRTISIEDLKLLFNYEPQKKGERIALDLFKFSFFTAGMNLRDILFIEKKDIYNNVLVYKRAKTHKDIVVRLENEAMEIAKKYEGEKYLFNFAEKKEYKSESTFTMRKTVGIGYNLKKIFKKLDINIPISMYYARHTWATMARKIKIDYDLIKLALGHSNSDVTAVYIEYDEEDIFEANRQVIDYVLKG